MGRRVHHPVLTSDIRPADSLWRAERLKYVVKELYLLPFAEWPQRAKEIEKAGIRREIVQEGINILMIEMKRRDYLDEREWSYP